MLNQRSTTQFAVKDVQSEDLPRHVPLLASALSQAPQARRQEFANVALIP
jgi:hypothetical protein|tara:strand:- start:160 stop:309 length:150 start_codon:yes stop_codon:yes gene_type:complete